MPELRQRSAVELDQHRAELVWAPLTELEEKPDFQAKGEEKCSVSQLLRELKPKSQRLLLQFVSVKQFLTTLFVQSL